MENIAPSTDIKKKLEEYVEAIIKEGETLSFEKESAGIWQRPEIIEYLEKIPVDEPTKYLEQTLVEIMGDLRGKKILCVGGGLGRLGRYIAKNNAQTSITEIDLSESMVQKANELAKLGSQNNFRSVTGDLRNIPFPDKSFDYAIAYGVFRYVPLKDQKNGIDEITRVCKHGATIAEGSNGNIISGIRDMVSPGLHIKETPMPMFRMTLCYLLLRKYVKDQSFKDFIDQQSKGNPMPLLSQIAGVTNDTFYELRLNSEK